MPKKTLPLLNIKFARVAELVDALDSKSSDSNIVPVRPRPRVLQTSSTIGGGFCSFVHFSLEQMKQKKYDKAYLKMAREWAKLSHCKRKQVGALIVKDKMIISDGYNGCPSGFENNCEDEKGDTKWYVLHAEANAIMKVARSTNDCKGATLYLTLSPCKECSKLIHQSGIKRLVYLDEYKDTTGLDFLRKANVELLHFNDAE